MRYFVVTVDGMPGGSSYNNYCYHFNNYCYHLVSMKGRRYKVLATTYLNTHWWGKAAARTHSLSKKEDHPIIDCIIDGKIILQHLTFTAEEMSEEEVAMIMFGI